MRTLLALVAVSLVPAIAHADQCALIDNKVAATARAFAKPGVRAVELCEPCGDKAPGAPFTIKTVDFRGNQLALNGKNVDLAYVYVENGPKEMKNLALASGCSATGISPYVRDGKPSGPIVKVHSKTTPPSMPPRPNMPRATSPDELVGTWTVKVTPWLSSCTLKPKPDETWDIDLTGGAFTITTSDNLTFEGAPAPLTHGSFTHSLRTRRMPSSTVLKLSHSMKDRFYGTIVRAEPSGGPNDPICVMQLNISGSRQP